VRTGTSEIRLELAGEAIFWETSKQYWGKGKAKFKY
jgi:hypothetical protein